MIKKATPAVRGIIESSLDARKVMGLRLVRDVVLPPRGPLTAEKGSDEVAKFNRPGTPARGSGPLRSEPSPSGMTHEGGTGYQRNTRSELFLRSTCNFAGEDSFYEKAAARDEKLQQLVAELAVDPDGWDWLQGFLPWLRGDGNMRSVSVLLSLEAVRARLVKGIHGGNRQLISAVLQRADEPGEAVAYWVGTHGKALPMPVKRGIADAASRLYTQRGYLRYDRSSQSFRFADVLELTHAKPRVSAPEDLMDHLPAKELESMSEEDVQSYIRNYEATRSSELSALYGWIITERHGRDTEPPPILRMVSARRQLSQLKPPERHTFAREVRDGDAGKRKKLTAAAAGQFEWVLSWLGEYNGEGKHTPHIKPLTKAEQWELVLPDLGYMALIRNLRNLDQAGISSELASQLAQRIADKEEVAKSRQLPFRFLAAHLQTPSLRWGAALETALTHSLQNIPELGGRSLILIDTSASMTSHMSAKSKVTSVQAAALFAFALATKTPDAVDVYGFADGNFKVTGVERGMSILKATEAFLRCVGNVGHGTRIEENVRATYKRGRHDRVFIFTDMQTFPTAGLASYYYSHTGNVASAVDARVPVYGFNLSGYSHSAMPVGDGNRHEMGGLTDATFKIIKSIEDGKKGSWPWLFASAQNQ